MQSKKCFKVNSKLTKQIKRVQVKPSKSLVITIKLTEDLTLDIELFEMVIDEE